MPRRFLQLHPWFLFSPDGEDGGSDTAAAGVAPADSGDGAPAGDAGGDSGDGTTPGAPESGQEQASSWPPEVQAEVTRMRQADAAELAKVRAEAADALALQERLNDESQRLDAINELAERYGLVPTDQDPAEELTPEQAALKAHEDEIAALKAAEDARTQEGREAQIRDHVYSGIDAYAESIGVPADEDLPEPITRSILAHTLSAPQTEAGLPDVAEGIKRWQAAEEATIARYLASKDGGTPDLSGSSGVDEIDTSTREGRLQAANAVAARHF